MEFAEAIRAGFAKGFNWKGRASRSEFWWFQLFLYIALFVAVGLAAVSKVLGTILIIAWLLIVYIPGLGVTVRRLHDTGRSGGWVFISFIPLVGPLLLLVFFIQRGDSVVNEYGPPTDKDWTPPAPTPIHQQLGVPEFAPGGFWCEVEGCRMYRVSQDSPTCVACGSETINGAKWAKMKGLTSR